MSSDKTIFSQVMQLIHPEQFRRCVCRYHGQARVRRFACWDQFLAMAFAQLTYRESLVDIEICLRSRSDQLYRMGFRSTVAHSTLADANRTRDWRIYQDLAYVLISRARRLYVNDPLDLELEQTVYALDSTIIDLCLSLFPWARYRSGRAGLKLHTLLDLRGPVPAMLTLSVARESDFAILGQFVPEAGSFYVMDRGYLDFEQLYAFTQAGAFFVTRSKRNIRWRRLRSCPTDRPQGVLCDQWIRLSSARAGGNYPERLRRVKYRDKETGKVLVFWTNHFDLPPLTIAQLYKHRWRVELFFKWIKQHLRIRHFYGTSPNAVKTQVWIAICVYVLVAILRKQLGLTISLSKILQILSVHSFAQVPLSELVAKTELANETDDSPNQLILNGF
jgi:hypothetical protein